MNHTLQNRRAQPHRLIGGLSVTLLAIGFLWTLHAGGLTSAIGEPKPASTAAGDSAQAASQTGGQDTPRPGGESGPDIGMKSLAARFGRRGDFTGDVPPRGFTLATSPPLPRYRVTELITTLAPGEKFEAARLNHAGEVVGTISLPGPPDEILTDAAGNRRIRHVAQHTLLAVWRDGVFHRMPVPKGFYSVVAGAINDAGEAAGISIIYRRARPAYTRIVLYDRDGHMTDIGTLDPKYADKDTTDFERMRGVSADAVCLNNRGTLTALVGADAYIRRADGTIQTLGQGIVLDLNDHDAAVGYSSQLASSAVLWPNVTAHQPPPAAPLLPKALADATIASDGRMSLTQSVAEAVNNENESIISVSTQMSSSTRQLGHITYYLNNGHLRLIASMRGGQHDHIRMNSAGDAVGFQDFDTDVHTFVPIYYRHGKLYDLRSAFAADGWTILTARDVNDKGQILAYGFRNDRGFPNAGPLLLTPE